ncbi:MAG: hypothetical protein MJE77_01820 [Proteobacteria bacterium]|nr:hypothetical protein [Pseudomonadota bacterium]
MNSQDLVGFLPFELQQVGVGQPRLIWCDFSGFPLTEPFFVRDVYRRLMMPGARLVPTDLDTLLNVDKVLGGLEPCGFIFHVSHCGSTLLANMLRKGRRNLVFAEPNVLTEFLRMAAAGEEERGLALFRAGVRALGQRRLSWEEHLVIKFSSFTALYLPLINAVFPGVPKLFLFRHPIEVLVSNMNTPYQEWLFDEMVTGLEREVMTESSTVLENCAHGLRRTMQAFLDHRDERSLFADYQQISPPLLARVLGHFRIPYDEVELAAMMEAIATDAKNPSRRFSEDPTGKQRSASRKVRRVAENLLEPLHRQLDGLKLVL